MRVFCIIDCLTAGGAQRQLCSLAVSLKKSGFEVSVLTYHPYEFFLSSLEDAGVQYSCIQEKNTIKRIFKFRKILRSGSQDVVVAFLKNPCLLAELAAFPFRHWGLVVSERNAYIRDKDALFPWRRILHSLADYVTVNSHTNRLLIEKDVKWLRNKIITVYNSVDLDHFRPAEIHQVENHTSINFLVVGKYSPQKNILAFISAVAQVNKMKPGFSFSVTWYGDYVDGKTGTKSLFELAEEKIKALGLESKFKLHPPVSSIVTVYQSCSALVLPSLFEGLPNVVCEAMACGVPVLMSNVCDSGNMVKEMENGLLFDPLSVDDMSEKLIYFCELPVEVRREMGRQSRKLAEQLFDPQRFSENYIRIINAAAARKKLDLKHWVPDVPDSAYQSVKQLKGLF